MRKSKIIENQKQLLEEYAHRISVLEDREHFKDVKIMDLYEKIKEKDKIIQKLVDSYCKEE